MAGRLRVAVGFRGLKPLFYANVMSRLKPRPTKLIAGWDFSVAAKVKNRTHRNSGCGTRPLASLGEIDRV